MDTDVPMKSYGSLWEEELFGVTAGDMLIRLPEHKNRRSSFQEIMQTPLVRFGEEGRQLIYDPIQPDWGMSGELWHEVRKNLPDQEDAPLSLYIACRNPRTSLDYWHGADAFFFWDGACVTLDASLCNKEEPKANFVITPENMEGDQLINLGCEIARFLKKMRRSVRKKSIKKSRHFS